MRVLLFGASGMVGKAVLLEALDDARVSEIVSIGRSPSGVTHPKLREVGHADFIDFSGLDLTGFDACFFCLGISSAGMSEPEYARVTYDFTLAAASALVAASPQAVFTYVSGVGTDSSERGRSMWARVKGRTENALLALPFRGVYMFRPGLIIPERGIRSRTGWYRAVYALARPFFGLLKKSRSTTTTRRMGHAMLEVAMRPSPARILEAHDINALAAAYEARRAG